MTVSPGYEAPPAAPKPANRRGLMIGIGVAVVLCLLVCIVGAVIFSPAIGPTMAGAQLPQTCAERTGLDAQTCGEWVQAAGSAAIGECVADQMEEGTTVTSDSLYDCLVERVGAPQ
jgi:hypothetical protein